MNKPTLLLSPGTGWSASTPHFYTLCWDNKYACHGHDKEHGWLRHLYRIETFTPKQRELYDTKRRFFHRVVKGLGTDERRFDDRKIPALTYPNPDVPWSKEKEDYFFDIESTSIDKYIEYYLELRETTKHKFAAVCDFSNSLTELPPEFLQSIAPKLKENFNIKVTFQFRDPIRRFFSMCNRFIYDQCYEIGKFWLISLTKEPWRDMRTMETEPMTATEFFINHVKDHCESGYLEWNVYYTDIINMYEEAFGKENVLPIVMENHWGHDGKGNPESLKRLSEFLDFPITKLHENVYTPDMGINAPKYKWLSDQWTSDREPLTQEIIDEVKPYFKCVYDAWLNKFGSIPKEWEQYD